MTPVEELWQDLTHVTEVRRAIAEMQDPVMRLFIPRDVERVKQHQWGLLEETIRVIEEKYPGFYLWWLPEHKCYGLYPQEKKVTHE